MLRSDLPPVVAERPGGIAADRHLFADDSLPDYDEGAATLLKERVLGFLADVE